MGTKEAWMAVLLCILTVAVLSVPVFLIRKRYTANRKLRATIYVLVLLWLARFAVGVCGGIGDGGDGLNVTENLFDSMVHALQTFSMDESYTEYTVAGKGMLEAAGHEVWAVVYGVVISILNLCAPVLGGALLLDILTGVFPHIKLYFAPFRQKFIFSELNEASMTLAEDIFRNDHYKEIVDLKRLERKPLVIFTDAYPDPESEASSELFGRAKAIGAVCIKTDLLHLPVRKSRSVNYFLIDAETHENISSLPRLLERDTKGKLLWPEGENEKGPVTKIFVFAQDDIESTLVKNICDNKSETASKVVIRTIRDSMNIAVNLMYDTPLFLPLLGRKEEEAKDIFVTILGSGQIAEETFKAVFWCGQIFGVQLHMQVLSRDASALKKRIEERYPELLESCRSSSELLKVYPFGGKNVKNPPYCADLRFVDISDATHFSEYPEGVLQHTDYFIAALGSDEQNVFAANQLKLLLARRELRERKGRHPVIAPAVFDENLAQTIEVTSPSEFETYIIPFATLRSRFSCKNVFMADFAKRASLNAAIYDHAKQIKTQDDEYTYWANLPRVVHAPYKLFGLGLIREVSLEKDALQRYIVKKHEELTERQEHELAWIEHRRWNAFMRTQGFTCPAKEEYDTYHQYFAVNGNYGAHKNVLLKLHPCLVESQIIPEPLPQSRKFDRSLYDCLDYNAMYAYHIETLAKGEEETAEGLRGKDYKQWDYRQHDTAVEELLKE